MAETIILDPSEIAPNRTLLDITPWLNQDGIDWGDAEIQAFMSESIRGEVPVDYRVPNRPITAPLMLADTHGGTTPSAFRTKLQSKVALWQREGGWIKRITNSGGTVYADVPVASFRATSVAGWESRAEVDLGAGLSLDAIPDFYGDEITDSDNSTTTTRELIFTTALDESDGDNPNRVRTVVDNDGSTDWRGLICCYRSRHYPGATAATPNTGSAAMAYEAESLGTLDTATKVAGTSIYGTATASYWSGGGTIVHHGTLSTSWTPALSGRIGGTTYPTHTGTYRMLARVASTSGTTVRLRSVYDVGDLVNPVENNADIKRLPGANNPYILDLGEVRIDPAPVGTHRWDWQIQGIGDAGGENLSIDKVWLANTDEVNSVLTAPLLAAASFTSFSARSEFTTESGAITGDSLQVGGTWSGAGDSDDFSVSAGIATRTANSDADANTGRYLRAGASTATTVTVQVDNQANAASGASRRGVFARYVDTSNWVMAHLTRSGGADTLDIRQRLAGSVTTLASVPLSGVLLSSSAPYYTVRLTVVSDGRVLAWFGVRGALLSSPVAVGSSGALATGGALASGGFGIYDCETTSDTGSRNYDNFAAWTSQTEAVVFTNQSAQLTTDGIFREDSGGTAYGPVSKVTGANSIPRFPVPANSGGTVETMLIPSNGDFDQIPDTMGTASISARNYRRPSWLFVPNG